MAVFGCIADDFTGASDAASFLVKGGMSVQLYNGIPDNHVTKINAGESSVIHLAKAQAIVIALKSRTQETDQAVADSLKAARFLLSQGVEQIYFKYCSTFDSTPKGNIGPVADALIDLLKAPYTLLCPALPVNGRTVEHGNLMVNGVFLHESHMKNHPLTPMWDSRIQKLMEPQSRYSCRNMTLEEWNGLSLDTLLKKPFYLIPDYKNTEDGEKIASVFGQLPLLTGGSGLLEPLARIWTRKLSAKGKIPESGTRGKALLLAGSCSKATLEQIAWYQGQGKPCYKLDPKAMMEGRQTAEEAWKFIEAHSSESDAVLVYSSDTPEKVKEFQKLGKEKVADMLEGTTAALAVHALNSGYTRIISAGGETSGAVTKELGFSSYWIGESVAPGVPVMVPAEKPNVRLILKSGNFGQEDFFGRALTMTLK
ncbi:3-oxo-tetronate kinase [Lacrimispora indolis]|uniref:3-oxo-tetronate kinase n=1 Tax=Lacrimispora indolis TaxID=69825 RepID=UPI00040AAE5D|nr:3-oxo-tetronate kinase [[Clostridium] methoxybenzovorans]